MENKPKIKLSFIRHTEHNQSEPGSNNKNKGLTDLGIQEAKDLSEKINLNPEQTIGFSPDVVICFQIIK